MSEQMTFLVAGAPPPPTMRQPPRQPPKTREPEPEEADRFDEWWALYPRRVSKGTARRAWTAALRKAPAQAIIDGLKRYAFSPDPKFRPHPSTWLNGERWADVEEDLAADAWGIDAWLQGLRAASSTNTTPAAKLSVVPAISVSALSYGREALDPVLLATGWDVTWRGDLSPLNDWLSAGYLPDSIAMVVAEAVAEFGQRRTLLAFDKRVRNRAAQIAL